MCVKIPKYNKFETFFPFSAFNQFSVEWQNKPLRNYEKYVLTKGLKKSIICYLKRYIDIQIQQRVNILDFIIHLHYAFLAKKRRNMQ